MKRFFLLVIVGVVTAASLWAINPGNLNSVTFYNNTGFDIWYLFFSPGDSNQWGADILGSTRTLDDGEEVGFFVHYPDRCNQFDFMAIDEDGDAYFIWDYQICDGREEFIEITLADYEPGEAVQLDFAEVSLMNDTPYDMYYVFVSPSDSQMWGIDMLDEFTILEPDDVLSLAIPVSKSQTLFDILAVDEDADRYVFRIELNNQQSSYRWAIEMSYLQ